MTKSNIIVYIGDVTSYLADLAICADSSARFIDVDNCFRLEPGTYYTSLGDLQSLANLGAVLRQATSIVYAPPANWSDQHKGHSKMQAWTESYLSVFANEKIVEGYSVTTPMHKCTMLALADVRKTNDCQLWVAGCSVTAGVGVTPAQRYGQLLSDQLEMPVSFLSHTGSSLTWAADQILRSDIRAHDVVVWGLTNIERFPYFKDNKITHVNAAFYERNPEFRYKVDISFLDSQQLIYQAITEIHQVINFCNKIQAKLILAQLLGQDLELYLHGYPNYQMLHHQHGRDPEDIFIDLGDDNLHPGPLMHQWYCQKIAMKYQQVYKENL